MSNPARPRHTRPVLDRATPRPADYALAWRTVHGDRHWPAVTHTERRTCRTAHGELLTFLEDVFPTSPIPAVVLGGAA